MQPLSFEPHEKVGENFQAHALIAAQSQAWDAVRETASHCKPGSTEADAHAILKEILKAKGVDKIWHPPQIRFGKNTTKAFGVKGDSSVVLQKNDLFFLDIGPIFDGYEGDVGATFVVGNDPNHLKIAADAKQVFDDVKAHWERTGLSGAELYKFAADAADERGWKLSLEGASGHRVSEFPHAVHWRGKLRTYEKHPSPDRWILEIHLLHPDGLYGAFFEDLL